MASYCCLQFQRTPDEIFSDKDFSSSLPIVDWNLPPVYDEYTEDGFLILYDNQNSTPMSFDSEASLLLCFDESPLKPDLYLVGTPVGKLEDITLRALRVLKSTDVILSEDTRHSGKLLQHYNIKTPLLSFHKCNESQREHAVLKKLREGEIVAQISDAGTPGISDPGMALVKLCVDEKIPVIPIPGPSALVAGPSASGLATDEFTFVGFLPKHDGSRRERLIVAANETATQIFFVPPHKLCQFIEDAVSSFGEQRQCVIAQEMTKIHEEFWRGTLGEAKEAFSTRQPKGEITFLVKVKKHFDWIESPIFDGKTTIIVEEVFKANDEFQMHGGSFEQLHAVDPFWNSIEGFASKNPWVTYLEHNLKETTHLFFGVVLKFRYEKINFKYKIDADKIRRKLFQALETRGRVFSTGGE